MASLALTAASCGKSSSVSHSVLCSSNNTCGANDVCDMARGVCISQSRCQAIGVPASDGSCQVCGDGKASGGEPCDEGGDNDGRYGGCNSDCTRAAYCGDGVLSDTEPCDDSAEPSDVQNPGWSCSSDCTQARFACDAQATLCDDGDVCTTDSCSEELGCVHDNDTSTCHHLGFAVQPVESILLRATWPSFSVRLEGAHNNLILAATSPVSIVLVQGNGTLSGTTSVRAVDGEAVFGDLSYDVAETIVLEARSGSLPPVRFSLVVEGFVAVAAGFGHTCAVTNSGGLWCWGGNGSGQLGSSTATFAATPVREQTHASNWRSVSAGALHTCAIKTNGSLWCWGDNGAGQLGDNSNASTAVPVQEATLATTWKHLAAGGGHTCATKTDGSLWCWGDNVVGQLGDDSAVDKAVPTQEATHSTDWQQASAGSYHTCATKTGGSLWCWGHNSRGQLGDNSTAGKAVPTQEASQANNWRQVVTGSAHTCATKTGGSLWCWGFNFAGQIGDDSTVAKAVPAQEATHSTDWQQASAGSNHTCATKTDSSLWCWGDNEFGQLGDSSTASKAVPSQEATRANTWQELAAGNSHSCATKTDGSLWCWGDNVVGQLGDGTSVTKLQPTQERSRATEWQQLAVGNVHTCATKTDGSLWCWGENSYGQIGDGTTTNKAVPTQEATLMTTWKFLAAGDGHTCAIKTDGSLWCWGHNYHGQIGDGTVVNKDVPTQEATLATNWKQLAAGDRHTCATKTDGSLWCWGYNEYGQLGDSSTTNKAVPTQEATLARNWQQVAAGSAHTCATKTDGSLWCWGYNSSAQLGDGTSGSTANKAVPTQEATLAKNWQQVAAGFGHTCATKTDGSLWCWGYNSSGQLGDGTSGSTANKAVPTQEATLARNWQQVAAGSAHTCATKTDGSLWCWGYNSSAQLGDGTVGATENKTKPVREVGHATNWQTVDAGTRHTCATKTDGSLWCWGTSEYGQLGTGPYWRATPGPIVMP